MTDSNILLRRFVSYMVICLQLVTMSPAQKPDCASCPGKDKNTWYVDPGSAVSCGFSGDKWSPATGYLCNFTQSCTQAGAGIWQQKSDYMEISGAGSDYSASSTLHSPALHVRQASCLSFHFAQTLPSKFVVIVNSTCIFQADDKQQSQFQPGSVSLPPGNTTIEFRAYNLAKPDTWVKLKTVTLREGKCPETVTSPQSTGQSTGATCYLVSLKVICTATLTLYLYLRLSY